MRRIVKIGGSLLTRRDFVQALPQWLDRESPAQTLLVVGGGELIDAVRHLDRLHPANSSDVHWRCVDLLQCTFEIVSEWFEQWHKIDTPRELAETLNRRGVTERPALVSVRSFYWQDCGLELPLDWSTTSDSLAAALAIQADADELVLLKSCEVNPTASIQSLAKSGIVDAVLPTLAGKVNAIRIEKLATASS